MSTDPYSARVRALFDSPAHAGDLDHAVCSSADDQGVHIQLFADVEAGSIRVLRFRAWGCPHVIATAEAFCQDYEGRQAVDLGTFTASELMQSLPVPVEKSGRILVIEDAVRSLGKLLCGTSDIHD